MIDWFVFAVRVFIIACLIKFGTFDSAASVFFVLLIISFNIEVAYLQRRLKDCRGY